MTTLPNKNGTFNGCNSVCVMGRRERAREKDTGSGWTQAENSDKLQGSIFVPSFKSSQQIALLSSFRACEHVHLEIGYCYEDRR